MSTQGHPSRGRCMGRRTGGTREKGDYAATVEALLEAGAKVPGRCMGVPR